MQAVGDQQSSPFRIRRSRRTLKLCLLSGRPDAHATLTHSKQNIVHRTNDECSPHVRPTARTRSSRRPVYDPPQRPFAKRQATKGCTLTFDQLRVIMVLRSHRSNWSTIIRSKKPRIRQIVNQSLEGGRDASGQHARSSPTEWTRRSCPTLRVSALSIRTEQAYYLRGSRECFAIGRMTFASRPVIVVHPPTMQSSFCARSGS